MARTKTNTQINTKTRRTPRCIRHLETNFFVVFFQFKTKLHLQRHLKTLSVILKNVLLVLDLLVLSMLQLQPGLGISECLHLLNAR